MKRRFTDTGKWNQAWFRGLEPEAKLVFLYLLDNCDDAGFWEYDLELAVFHIGLKPLGKFSNHMQTLVDTKRVDWFDEETIWIPKFVPYQFPNGLKDNYNPHKPVLKRLKKYNIEPLSLYPKQGLGKAWASLIDKDKDKDKAKDKEMDLDRGVLRGVKNVRN
jgi:hypothetical protein